MIKHNGVQAGGGAYCYDNASVEMFFQSLRTEATIFQYINGFCNTRRRHSYLGGISPLAFEAKAA